VDIKQTGYQGDFDEVNITYVYFAHEGCWAGDSEDRGVTGQETCSAADCVSTGVICSPRRSVVCFGSYVDPSFFFYYNFSFVKKANRLYSVYSCYCRRRQWRCACVVVDSSTDGEVWTAHDSSPRQG